MKFFVQGLSLTICVARKQRGLLYWDTRHIPGGGVDVRLLQETRNTEHALGER